MSLLTRKLDEAKRLLELYTIYKDSDDDWRRRKAHVDLDRFLMENREMAIMCIEQVLQTELDALVAESKKKQKKPKLVKRTLRPPWYQRLAFSLQRRRAEGGADNDGTLPQQDATARDA
jgi:hypothetical protein